MRIEHKKNATFLKSKNFKDIYDLQGFEINADKVQEMLTFNVKEVSGLNYWIFGTCTILKRSAHEGAHTVCREATVT